MLKQALSFLFIGAGCISLALLSTSFSGLQDSSNNLLSKSHTKTNKITKINSYGEIDAYGLQNGCTFKILDQDKPYSLADFLVKRKSEVYGLEEAVTKLANDSKQFCSKDFPIVTFSYVPIGKAPNIVGTFKIAKTPIKKD